MWFGGDLIREWHGCVSTRAAPAYTKTWGRGGARPIRPRPSAAPETVTDGLPSYAFGFAVTVPSGPSIFDTSWPPFSHASHRARADSLAFGFAVTVTIFV